MSNKSPHTSSVFCTYFPLFTTENREHANFSLTNNNFPARDSKFFILIIIYNLDSSRRERNPFFYSMADKSSLVGNDRFFIISNWDSSRSVRDSSFLFFADKYSAAWNDRFFTINYRDSSRSVGDSSFYSTNNRFHFYLKSLYYWGSSQLVGKPIFYSLTSNNFRN